jgi:hypothetical protein
MPERDYDVFENLPDGQKRWQCCVHGIDAANRKVEELSRLTKNEVFAVCVSTKEIVARANPKDPNATAI